MREDVTRFRYGDEQHLDEALTRIFRYALTPARTAWQCARVVLALPCCAWLAARAYAVPYVLSLAAQPPPAALNPCSFGQAGGIPRRLCPILVGLREEVTDGQYTLVRPA